MKSIDARKEKIRNLKKQIIKEQDEITNALGSLDLVKELELPKEQQETNKGDLKNIVAVKRATIQSLKKELELTRMNKYSSSFFEYLPSLPNRSQARQFRKNRNKNARSL